jgi:hypothetical protein
MLTVTFSVIFEAQMTKNVAVNGASKNAGYNSAFWCGGQDLARATG